MDFSSHLYVFILAAFLGLEVIKRVSPLLHTPLMSLTNAISAISVVAAIEICGLEKEHTTLLATVLGTIAVAAATTNIVGGFMITDRMLKMFKRREVKK
jgi:NAD(P) transhydrogenase subunit alpha